MSEKVKHMKKGKHHLVCRLEGECDDEKLVFLWVLEENREKCESEEYSHVGRSDGFPWGLLVGT